MTSPPSRVETVRVRRTGRRPLAIAVLVMALVAVSIVKPWAGAGRAEPNPAPASPKPAVAIVPVPVAIVPVPVAIVPVPTASAPGPAATGPAAPGPAATAETADVSIGTEYGVLAPGQVDCVSSDWRIVTLTHFGGWTVRTSIAITPVEASGPGDSSIPDLSLGASDIAGLGACAPSTWSGAPGRASRIVTAWRTSADGAPTATFARMTLAEVDPLPSGGPAGAQPIAPRSVAELVRPLPATQGGRWPAGRNVLLLASPDAGAGRWIAVDIGVAGR